MRTFYFKLTQDMIDEFSFVINIESKSGSKIEMREWGEIRCFYVAGGGFLKASGGDALAYDRMFYDYLKKNYPEVLL